MSRKSDEIDAYVGAMLKALRRARGWNQERLGEVVDISFQQIQKYEKGHNRLPVSYLLRFARALDFPILTFLPDNPDDPWASGR